MLTISLMFVLFDLSLLFVRLALGAIFLAHGPPKIRDKEAAGKAINMSPGFAFFVGVLESVSALLVLIGFFAQIAALGLMFVMIGALYKKIAEWKIAFTYRDKAGWEFDLAVFSVALLLFLFGPGRISIDWFLYRVLLDAFPVA